MFQKVVIPLDGSSLAEKVIPYVQMVTSPTETELLLVQNIDLTAYAFTAYRATGAVRFLDEMRKNARAYLSQNQEALKTHGYSVQTKIMQGDTATAINQVAVDFNADLIAMTTHGRTGLGRATLGSVADRVIRSTHFPILLVRAAAPEPTTDHIRKILVPLDGSQFSEQALPIAQSLAKTIGSHILLHQSIKQVDTELAELFDQLVDESGVPTDWVDDARSYLAQLQKQLGIADIISEYEVVIGEPAEAILNAASANSCDLIVMSTHGRSGISRWAYGSVASKVLHASEYPLLIVRGFTHEQADEIM